MTVFPALGESHLAVRNLVREFALAEIAPIASKFDESGMFPWETVSRMADLGLLGAPWSAELGGSGMDLYSYLIVIEELAKVDASHAITVSAHTTLGTSPIVRFGNRDQIRKYVPPLASGRVLGGFGLTEPSAGSDAAGTRTTAKKVGDRYILNGSKIFITHGGVGEIFVVTAVTEGGKGSKGISSFILTKECSEVDKAISVGMGHDPSLRPMRGFSAGRKEDKLGWRASDTRELIMEDVEVPAENLLGAEGEGFTNFMSTLDSGRIGIAALSLGIAEGAFEQAAEYAGVRTQFGQKIGKFQGVQFILADIATEIEAGRHLIHSAATLAMQGKPFTREAAMAKLFCSRLATQATIRAVQVFGGYGVTRDYPVERMMRDAKICEIGEGTSEVQRLVIARHVLPKVVD